MTLTSSLQLVTDVLTQATSNIDTIYFQLPVANETPSFRERVYCYELYHQMRLLWPKDFPYRITGEIDKAGHPIIRKGVLNRSKPDFTIHVPGEMNRNLLVVEVKAGEPCDAEARKDLRKLTGYYRAADYFAAYYLTYGLNPGVAVDFASRCKRLANGDSKIDLSLITWFNHREAGSPARKISRLT